MGVSSSLEVLLSEKHLNEYDHNEDDCEVCLLIRAAMETHQELGLNEIFPKQQQELVLQESNGNVSLGNSNLRRVEIPSYKEDDSNDDGFKTPTSEEHKIPVILQCPPAPKKPKTMSLRSTKRKGCRRRIIFGLTSKEIESLFPPPRPAVDLGAAAGGRNKKVKLST